MRYLLLCMWLVVGCSRFDTPVEEGGDKVLTKQWSKQDNILGAEDDDLNTVHVHEEQRATLVDHMRRDHGDRHRNDAYVYSDERASYERKI